MEYSAEQKEIFEYGQKGLLNLIVQAVAGSGKTTTLVECARRLKADYQILMLAHNVSTKDTLKERIGDCPNVRVYTLHGLAWHMYAEHFGTVPTIDEDKYRTYIVQNIETLASEAYHNLSAPLRMVYRTNVFDLVDKSRHNLKQSEKEIRKMATKKYGIRLVADECHLVASILKWGYENKEVVDYQDLLWFPSEFGYFTKRYLADVIMLDEAQDASLAQQDIVMRCFKRNTRLFAFGDRDQTINSWCGSDSDAFDHLKDASQFRRDAKEFPLTTNYRCGTKIIEYAKRYTENDIHAREGAQEGEVRHEASLNDVSDGDMILCRNVAPLMEVYRRGIAMGKKMYFRGEALGSKLKEDANSVGGDTIAEIIYNTKRKLIATWEYLTQEGLNEKETMTDPRVVSILDSLKTMENLPRTVETRADLDKFAKDMFSEEGREGIQLSTIHRAKGLEADNVFIICPSLIPSTLATMDWQKEEERHLLYVMCTRPKNLLAFITEKEVAPSNAFCESNSLHKELTKIKNEVYLRKII